MKTQTHREKSPMKAEIGKRQGEAKEYQDLLANIRHWRENIALLAS